MIKNIAALPIEKPLDNEVLNDAIAASDDGTASLINESIALQVILTRPDALAIAQNYGFLGTGQNLYDWAKAALTAKSKERKQLAKEKLAAVGLAPTFSNEGKIAWLAIAPTKQGEGNENS